MKWLAGLLAFFSFSAHSATAILSQDLPDLVEKILPSVVNISAVQVIQMRGTPMDDFFRFWGVPMERERPSLGSGFIIDETGFILTNNHVVERANEVRVTLQNKKQYEARIVGRDPKLDIALLQIRSKEGIPSKWSAASLADSSKVRIAEPVLAIGNPFGLQHTVTSGIVSALNRTIGIGPFDNFIQTDASINPGNSGGPLFNLKGEVIGINTLIFSKSGQSGGLGFAIPINEAKNVLSDLKRYGRVPRPWLGLLGETVTPQLQMYYGLSASEGVLVYNLVRRGPADQNGIRVGDILLKINGKEVTHQHEVEKIIVSLKPNESVEVELQRESKKLKKKIQLKEHPPLERLPKGVI